MVTKLIKTASGMEVRIWEGDEPIIDDFRCDFKSVFNEAMKQYLSSYKSYPVRREDEEAFWDLAFDTYCFNKKLDNSNLPSSDEIDDAISQGIEIPSERVGFDDSDPYKWEREDRNTRYATILTENNMEKTKEEYTPYDIEWVTEISKLPKAVIITMFANKGTELDLLREKYDSLHTEYKKAIDKLSKVKYE
jgi:hypothetical protein